MRETTERLDRAQRATVVVSCLAIAVVVGAIVSTPPGGPPSSAFAARDISGALAGVFHPGVILGAGSNGTDTLLAGIGVYVRSPEFTLPVLGDLRAGPSGPLVENLTASVDPYFFEGGTYALGWNGSAWLVGGQASWGGINDGTLVSLHGTQVTNLTPLIAPYFAGGGIFALGWNGSAWLLGGNASWGISVVGVHGAQVQNLSGLVPDRDPLGWIQLIAWNGAEWLLGGQEVFGTLSGWTYHDLLPATPFATSGVYAGAWNGTAWLAGGGGARLVIVQGDAVRSAPALPAWFDQAVLLVTPYGGGWIVGGKGTAPGGGDAPGLFSWDGAADSAAVSDLSDLIPSTFQGGEIQGGGWAPAFGGTALAVVGEGNYDQNSGYGVGAIALVTVP